MGHSTLRNIALALVFLAPPSLVMAAAIGVGTHFRAVASVAATAAHGSNQTVSIDLGRIVCGDCCVGNVWDALGEMPGVQDIDIGAGRRNFTVFYDGSRADPEKILASLIAAGESQAALAASGSKAVGTQDRRRWVRSAKR